jgi:hypothetical protein
MGMPSRSAALRTGEATRSLPLPAGRSGWVTTPTTLSGPSQSVSKVTAAVTGVPMKIIDQFVDIAKNLDAAPMGLQRIG